jgi:hypothetical protein
MTNVIGIAAGYLHSLALLADGRIVAWGDDSYGQSEVDPDLFGSIMIAAGYYHSLSLQGVAPAPPSWTALGHRGTVFTAAIATTRGRPYFPQFKSDLLDANWTWLPGILGDGTVKTLTDATAAGPVRFYRIRRQ